jgi:hypothetical protein
MGTFQTIMEVRKQYSTRRSYSNKEEALAALSQYLKDGEVPNTEFGILKDALNRFLRKDIEVYMDFLLDIMRNYKVNSTATRVDRVDQYISDIYYSTPDNLSAINTFEKKLNAIVKTKPHPELSKKHIDAAVADGRALIASWKGAAEGIANLSKMVIKSSVMRDRAKATAAKEMGRKFTDSSSLIKVLESHLNEYIEQAKIRSAEFVRDKLQVLSKSKWDLAKVAPKPKSSSDKAAQSKRDFYLNISKAVPKTSDMTQEEPVVPNRANIDAYITQAAKGAEMAYQDFVQKMITKIGKPVVKADLTGSIWTNAVITVETDDGETQKWSTKMIMNFSKYQKIFNQFPTRRMK